MKTLFYIDAAFDYPIFLNVEDGIFIGCDSKGKMQSKIDELYIGKLITFLKTDLEAKMKGVYYRVKPLDYGNYLKGIFIIKQGINRIETIARERNLTESEQNTLIRLERELSDTEDDLTKERENLKENHYFAI